jgi:hypothetical protein
MKKIIFLGIVLAIAGAVAINVSINSQESTNLSAISLANIEVLASGESSIRGCKPSGGYCEVNGIPVVDTYPHSV